MIKEINAYQTSDGKVFADSQQAETHQRVLNITSDVTDVIDEFWYYGITREAVIEHLVELLATRKDCPIKYSKD